MAFVVSANLIWSWNPVPVRAGRSLRSLRNSMAFFYEEEWAMGIKTQRAWSPEARQRHLDGRRRSQERLAEWNYFRDWCEAARMIGVDVKSLLFAVNAISKTKFDEMCAIKPREERFMAFKNLVLNYCQGVTA